MSEGQLVKVWDPFVRVFHWTLVGSYAAAWVTAEELEGLHEQLGYFILALLGLRIIWGFIGSQHARFSDFVMGPKKVFAYLSDLAKGRPQHWLGHNPAGGWMVVALILMMGMIGLSGYMMGGDEHSVWGELHEGLAEFSLFLVVLHVLGVFVSGLLHGENLVKAMFTGYKTKGSQDE